VCAFCACYLLGCPSYVVAPAPFCPSPPPARFFFEFLEATLLSLSLKPQHLSLRARTSRLPRSLQRPTRGRTGRGLARWPGLAFVPPPTHASSPPWRWMCRCCGGPSFCVGPRVDAAGEDLLGRSMVASLPSTLTRASTPPPRPAAALFWEPKKIGGD
jgi:hypothetical protein